MITAKRKRKSLL